MKDFFIGVAGHKKYDMPKDNSYVPIQVGASGKMTIPNFTRDDIGDNISNLNSNYSELTGIYYIWKNVNSRYKGLVHYRRYLKSKENHFTNGENKIFDKILTTSDLESLFKSADVILPQKRKYYIETNYSHYVHAHPSEALKCTKNIISEMYPKYRSSYDEVMNARSAHMFNMFIMKSEFFDEYCEWLFSILFELQNRLDISDYSQQEARVFGYVSELLLDVWLKNNKISFVEVPVLYVEGQQLFKKGIGFIKRKVIGHGEAHIKSHVD